MTENEKRLQETIESRNGAIEKNGFVNLATIQKTRKNINDRLKEIEEHWK